MDDPAKTHPVHATLEQLSSLSKSSQLSDLNAEIDDPRRHALDRIFYVASEARKRVSRLNGVRANLSAFSNINSSAQAIRQELENYISNKNLGHIDNAISQADQGLAIHLSQLPSASPATESEAALESFRKSSRSAVGELKANEGILKKQIEGLQQTIAEQDERIRQAQEQIQESKQELTNTLSTTEANFNSLKSTIETEFASLRESQSSILEKELLSSTNLVDHHLGQLEEKKKRSCGHCAISGRYPNNWHL